MKKIAMVDTDKLKELIQTYEKNESARQLKEFGTVRACGDPIPGWAWMQMIEESTERNHETIMLDEVVQFRENLWNSRPETPCDNCTDYLQVINYNRGLKSACELLDIFIDSKKSANR